MAIAPIRKQQFSGTSKIFDGTLEKKLNEIITAVNGEEPASTKPEIEALTPIADPSTATSQAIAEKLNDVIAALKA
ncbi:MAG: hypothetical protein M9945_14190 [Aquamicrobium sp.]|uniref:hypothetical protein n=1 Tax=Aquamicrobium sp. TaxID=1872579 RepID=UPI00349EC17D|nr:hypothetical protein [Aquamicrobium sp.]